MWIIGKCRKVIDNMENAVGGVGFTVGVTVVHCICGIDSQYHFSCTVA